jgi:hypothetical protein
MKKQICYLLAILLLVSASKVNANPLGEINANAGAYEAGAFNKLEQTQVNSYKLDRSYIHSLDYITKDESIYDASVEENVAREGVLYNPHFLLEKINFEGNTQISDEELIKKGSKRAAIAGGLLGTVGAATVLSDPYYREDPVTAIAAGSLPVRQALGGYLGAKKAIKDRLDKRDALKLQGQNVDKKK